MISHSDGTGAAIAARLQMIASAKTIFNPLIVAGLLVIALLWAGEIIRPGFSSYGQVMNLLRIAAFLGFVSAGQTLVVISGKDGIDLSVGAIVTMSAVIIFQYLDGSNANIPMGLGIACVVGGVLGAMNGIGVSYLGVPPLVMTLGTAGVVQGLIIVVTKGRPAGALAPLLGDLVFKPWVFGIPGVVACWAFLGIVMWVILHRTVYGKQLFLIGANRTAAHLSGVKIGPMVVTTYALSGLLASLGGVVLLGYTGSVFINLGNEYVLPSVAAVAMGGTLLSGGVGGYTGTILGAMVLTLVQSLLITVGFPEFARQIVFGGVLIAVLSLYGRQRL
jgi:ribose transport system permease protein